MILILLGAPGAGKGTQSEILQQELGVLHISSGDLLREHRKRGTELGKVAATYMVRGELVPDKLIVDMIVDRISAPDAEHGVLFDGFPRTLPQAEALDDALDLMGKRVSCALYINADPELLIERLSNRWTCRNCQRVYGPANPPAVPGVCDVCGGELYQRDDDKRETVAKRQEVYFRETLPIVGYYRHRNTLCEVDGNQPIESVTASLLACLR